MIKKIPRPFVDDMCFFCGKGNDSGLGLTFYHDEEFNEIFADYTPEQRFQGQGDIFHGGLQMGLLDEAMWWAGYAVTNIMEAVTVNASFRFLRPVFIGKPIRAICTVVAHEGNAITLKGAIRNSANKICTTVKGEYRVVDREKYEALLDSHR